MTLHKHFLDTYELILDHKVFRGDNGKVDKGSILVETCVKGCVRNIIMHDVLHVSNFIRIYFPSTN